MRAVTVHFQSVVSAAEWIAVADVGFTALDPRDSVIDIAGENVATRPDASPAADQRRSASTPGEHPGTSTQPDGHTR